MYREKSLSAIISKTSMKWKHRKAKSQILQNVACFCKPFAPNCPLKSAMWVRQGVGNCFSYQYILAHSAIPEPVSKKCRWEWVGDDRDKTRMGKAPFLLRWERRDFLKSCLSIQSLCRSLENILYFYFNDKKDSYFLFCSLLWFTPI